MGHKIRRVPLDFDHPLRTTWPGYLMPDRLTEDNPCPDCELGFSAHAWTLRQRWYGNAPFDPASTGSTPLTVDTPAVRAFAERNVSRAPEFYGHGEAAIVREAQRLIDMWNGQWCHHLAQDDVDALVAAGRLMDFTHTFEVGKGWQKIEPAPEVTAAQVNEWSLYGFGHDGINCMVVVQARCERDGRPYGCSTCDGHGDLEVYPGQRAEVEAWKPTEPPTGEGWQLWETVTEGSPVSPVFPDAEGLALWLTTAEGGRAAGTSRKPLTLSAARAFVREGWAPTLVGNAGGVHDGADFVGTEQVLREIVEGA